AVVAEGGNGTDLPALGAERFEERLLVPLPLLGDQHGVGPRRLVEHDLAASAPKVERRQVPAGEEVVEVARAEAEAVVSENAHGCPNGRPGQRSLTAAAASSGTAPLSPFGAGKIASVDTCPG